MGSLAEPAAYDTSVVPILWLSNAYHLHAYEMQPSVAEVERLCGVVAELVP